MAKRKITAAHETGATLPILSPFENVADINGAEPTGRFIIVFKEEVLDTKTIQKTLKEVAGLKHLPASTDYESGAIDVKDISDNEGGLFERLGIAVVSGQEAVEALSASISDADSPIFSIEPEYYAYLSSQQLGELQLDYLRGYRDAVNHLYDQFSRNGTTDSKVAEILSSFQDTTTSNWGLQATSVSTSRFNGQGIKVAVLDTGFDLSHPDFRGRVINSQTFTKFPVQDVHGHGTHCIGTACGPLRPATGVRRYGIAYNAQIFAGKVFNNDPKPKAAYGDVIAGIDWAVNNGCRVVSLSLGVPINQQLTYYEISTRRALNAGTLVVAAAGNNATRPRNFGFVEQPANADAAMAVAAVDGQLQIASFSSRSSQITGEGGKVNISGPGVGIFSSVPMGGHALFNGTSMATPHVAGIAALWSQCTGESGATLWSRLLQTVRPLAIPSIDVGAGLVQAPQ